MIGIIAAALLVLVAGLLALWWARASRRGTLPQNWIFGYRTPLTLRDKNAWVTVNRASARFAIIAGVGAGIASLVAIILALVGFQNISSVLLGTGLGWLLIWAILGVIPAHRAARMYKQTPSSS